jgi:LemA protein
LNHAALEHSVFTKTANTRTEIIKQSDLSPEAVDKIISALGASGIGGAGKGKGALPTDWGQALQNLFKGGGDMGASLGRLLAVVEQYPNVQSAKTYSEMMKALVNMEDLIATRRIEYNAVARTYNTAISKFPWKLLAEWTDFKRFHYFERNDADAAPILTLDIYKKLMPFEEGHDQ